MSRSVSTLVLALAVLLLASATPASAQVIVSGYCPPTVSYYAAPAPTVTYYTPAVSYYSTPAVSYYAAPVVSYYAAPRVSYYSAPAYATTTRYGLFGRPRYSTTYYYPGVYVGP
jgi:hypothetical protein